MFGFFKLKPYHTGYLPAEDAHSIYFQEIGNPNGIPVISFHGGPGGCGRVKHATIFNLKKYRVILFDQRGCGLSIFHEALYQNTTLKTIQDAKRLLNYLNIRRKVIVAGGSFGATCALLFAQTYPEMVSKLVLNSTFLGRRQDFENMTPVNALFYPDFLGELTDKTGTQNLFEYYNKRAFSNKHSDNVQAVHYCNLERIAGQLNPLLTKEKTTEKDIRHMQIAMHYMKNNFFLKDNQLLKNMPKIAHIPAFIYQNRLDFCCPPYQAYEIHRALPKSKLVIVPDSGHGGQKLYKHIRKDFS